jgi:high-affinity iron transporter
LLVLATDPPRASSLLAEAAAAYSDEFATTIAAADPESDRRIRQGFSELEAALAAGDAPRFASARAAIHTAIQAASFRIVEAALQQGDVSAAQAWLLVREFRTATRFSRPDADASVALDLLARGDVAPSEALQAVQADLLGTYQARLAEVLHDLREADERGFATRKAELASLAEGYFVVLEPAYLQQRGQAAADAARLSFVELRQAAVDGSADVVPLLETIQGSLRGFRAAPLSPRAESRRAGQLLRYLSLVPMEYGRGVAGGQVTQPLEIEEAATFLQAARAALEDLEGPLEAASPGVSAQADTLLHRLTERLDQARIGGIPADPGEIDDLSRRLAALLAARMPAAWLRADPGGDFEVIDSMLDQMVAAARAGEYALAESARLDAYALLEVGPEARLAFLAPALKARIEDLFWNGRGESLGLAYLIGREAAASEIAASRGALGAELKTAETILTGASSPASLSINAGIIVFREGLEAVLILASLLASTRLGPQRRYRSPIWLGTGLAMVATVLTWVAARGVLNSLARYGERLEAMVSLLAVTVLLLVTNWFFHKVYWTGWIASFHSRKRRILAGEAGVWLGLIALGFASVYREGFETVLFLQALLLEGQTSAVLTGVGLSLLAVLLVGWVTFRLQLTLPYRRMLIFTGVLIGAVLVVMVGKTAHVMQVIGWLPAHPIGVDLPIWFGTWFGVYGTWQGVSLQVVSILFVLGSYFLAERQQHRANRLVPSPNGSAG